MIEYNKKNPSGIPEGFFFKLINFLSVQPDPLSRTNSQLILLLCQLLQCQQEQH